VAAAAALIPFAAATFPLGSGPCDPERLSLVQSDHERISAVVAPQVTSLVPPSHDRSSETPVRCADRVALPVKSVTGKEHDE
jgi:hypothetical protein